MKSKVTPEFRRLLRALPKEVRAQARNAYRLFKEDPYHSSLHFKPITGRVKNLYSARVGAKYRALGVRLEEDVILWLWIGTHAEYDKRI
jgi:mRNA-degrading endonuclease RelE of RelBE toxin-antitoxin system